MSEAPDLDALVDAAKDLISAASARSGRPREIYERYLTAQPLPGVEWSTAVHERLRSLAAGPLPAHEARKVSEMVPARTTAARARAA